MALWYTYNEENYILVPVVIIGIILETFFTAFNAFLLFKELKKRNKGQTEFSSKWEKWSSILVLAFGCLHCLNQLFLWIQPFCYLSITISYMIDPVVYQFLLMEIYQLLRLRYLLPPGGPFKRYPLWILIFLGSYHVVLALSATFADFPSAITCGLNEDWDYHNSYKYTEVGFVINLWFLMAILSPFVEMITIFLFVKKLRNLLRVHPANTNVLGAQSRLIKIRRNMERIILLSLLCWIFYSIFWVGRAIAGTQHFEKTFFEVAHKRLMRAISDNHFHDSFKLAMIGVPSILVSTSYNLSIYLILSHNSKDYSSFLRYLIGCKLHYCCCCCRHIILEQQRYFVENSGGQRQAATPSGNPSMVTAANDFSIDCSPSRVHQNSLTVPLLGAEMVYVPAVKAESELAKEVQTESSKHRASIINNFLFEESTLSEQQFTSNFSFGVYLEYWRRNKKNFVNPKYKNLREELMSNSYRRINVKRYNELEDDCRAILERKSFNAKDIGITNKICKIEPGTPMTIHHAVAVKVYTDFDDVQREFKRHCRRLRRGESIESVMDRNSEIAHWCRLLKEAIMFYGDSMGKSQVVYSGMNARLVFKSMMQHFECPLSTTPNSLIAERFTAGSSGIILKLKRANPKTRYLNVAPFSCFNEKELLFMGSTLKIVDILLKDKSLKKWVSALRVFEQILNGHFIDGGDISRKTLSLFLHRVIGLSVLDILLEQRDLTECTTFLNDDAYDTDAVLHDIDDDHDVDDSNITWTLGDNMDRVRNVRKLIQDTHASHLDTESTTEAKYVWSLFCGIMGEMKTMAQNDTLWVNYDELNKAVFVEIKEALFGDGELFDIMGVDQDSIGSVQQYQWMIEGVEYQELRELEISEYITSPQYQYAVNEDIAISFHFRFYGRYKLEDDPKCAIFLEIDSMPKGVDRVRIEVDMKCIKKKEYRQLLKMHILTKERNVCGFKVFDHSELMRNECIEWVFGVKIFGTEAMEQVDVVEDENHNDLYQYFA